VWSSYRRSTPSDLKHGFAAFGERSIVGQGIDAAGFGQAAALAADDWTLAAQRADRQRILSDKTKPIHISEFDAEKKWWGTPDARGGFKGRRTNGVAWKVSADEAKANGYNLDFRNPHDGGGGPDDPDQLLVEFKRMDHDVHETLASLGGVGVIL